MASWLLWTFVTLILQPVMMRNPALPRLIGKRLGSLPRALAMRSRTRCTVA
jgi:hypothetical protein